MDLIDHDENNQLQQQTPELYSKITPTKHQKQQQQQNHNTPTSSTSSFDTSISSSSSTTATIQIDDISNDKCNCVKCSIAYHEAYIKGIHDITLITCKKCKLQLLNCKCCLKKLFKKSNNSFNMLEMRLGTIKNELSNLNESSIQVYKLFVKLGDTINEFKTQIQAPNTLNSNNPSQIINLTEQQRQLSSQEHHQNATEYDIESFIDDTDSDKRDLTKDDYEEDIYQTIDDDLKDELIKNDKIQSLVDATNTLIANTISNTNSLICLNTIQTQQTSIADVCGMKSDSLMKCEQTTRRSLSIKSDFINDTHRMSSFSSSPSTTSSYSTSNDQVNLIEQQQQQQQRRVSLGKQQSINRSQPNRNPSFKFESNILNRVQTMNTSKPLQLSTVSPNRQDSTNESINLIESSTANDSLTKPKHKTSSFKSPSKILLNSTNYLNQQSNSTNKSNQISLDSGIYVPSEESEESFNLKN